jgi:nitroimidazol reductase NimA-like FMN-containing flavoprotein (pyridoxamine 5'-phosphate oxidase superfamily)
MNEEQVRERVRVLLASQPLAVLATVMDGQPHCNLVAFAHTDDMRCVLFATARGTRKYESLVQHPVISMLVDSRTNRPSDFDQAEAVTIDGRARDLGAEKARFLDQYLRKHGTLQDFASEPDTALICLQVTRFKYVTQFQQVRIVHPAPPEADQGVA